MSLGLQSFIIDSALGKLHSGCTKFALLGPRVRWKGGSGYRRGGSVWTTLQGAPRKRDIISVDWVLHLQSAKIPKIVARFEGLLGGKRGLASIRLSEDTENTLELTWKDPVHYQSVFSFCRSNLKKNEDFLLTAFNIEDSREPMNIRNS
jgi:hypothetical protein